MAALSTNQFGEVRNTDNLGPFYSGGSAHSANTWPKPDPSQSRGARRDGPPINTQEAKDYYKAQSVAKEAARDKALTAKLANNGD